MIKLTKLDTSLEKEFSQEVRVIREFYFSEYLGMNKKDSHVHSYNENQFGEVEEQT